MAIIAIMAIIATGYVRNSLLSILVASALFSCFALVCMRHASVLCYEFPARL